MKLAEVFPDLAKILKTHLAFPRMKNGAESHF
jgi:hypothetical protein